MSRIGKLPVEIPSGAEVTIKEDKLQAKGPKGTLNLDIHPDVKVEQKDKEIIVSVVENCDCNALWGTYRQLVSNILTGVTEGFEKKLEVVGVGYKAQAQGKKLVLNVGYSDPKEVQAPEGIEFKVEKEFIIISGADKQVVGQVAAEIRAIRPPEPYKGKGIKYEDEHVRRKEGKKAVAAGE